MLGIFDTLPQDIMNVKNLLNGQKLEGAAKKEATLSAMRITGILFTTFGAWYMVSNILSSNGTVSSFARSAVVFAVGHDLLKVALKISTLRKEYSGPGFEAAQGVLGVLDLLAKKIQNGLFYDEKLKDAKNKQVAIELAKETFFKTILIAAHTVWVDKALDLIARP